MKKIIIPGLLVSACVAFFLSPFASTSPDGLERVAGDKGFITAGEGKNVIKSPMTEYLIPGIKNEAVSMSIAGLIGVGIVFGGALTLGYTLKKRK
jgi:cobalt/nickel transport protein